MKMLHCPRCQQQAHRLKRSSHQMNGEEAVVISLAISLGMIGLTILGWWLWKIFARIAEVMFTLPPGEMP